MEFTEVINNRYSCKKYNGEKITDQQLQAILEAGQAAPTAKNLQEQHIYVITSEEGFAKIDAITPCRYQAGTVLLVAYDKNNVYTYPGMNKRSGVEDATIVATHMILAAANEGVDSCWVNNMDPDAMAAAFGLPENEEIVMMMDLGYRAEGAGPLPNHFSRKELKDTVTFL
ncbi:MAG: nitroreductase family protein [Lachnospiraceae bacterium]|nr:nitroreductase family protein [Lachnospiraceae bacterium]